MPHSYTIALFAWLALSLQAPPLAAQTVYRCGNSYSESPCAGGKAVKVDDARTPEQQAKAKADHEEAKKSAKELERERLAEEDGQLPDKRVGARKPAAPRKDTAAKSDSSRSGSGKPVMNYFTAIAPHSKDKARKSSDKALDGNPTPPSAPRQP